MKIFLAPRRKARSGNVFLGGLCAFARDNPTLVAARPRQALRGSFFLFAQNVSAPLLPLL